MSAPLCSLAMLSAPQATLISATVLSCFGMLECLFGYRLFRLVLGLFGFLAFGLLGFALGSKVFPNDPGLAFAASGIGAILGALIAWYFFLFALALFGFTFGALTAYGLGTAWHGPHHWGLDLLAGALAAVLVVWLRRPLIIVATAFGGGQSIALAWIFFLHPTEAYSQLNDPRALAALLARHDWVPVLGAVLGVLGCLFQFRDLGGRSGGEEKSKKKGRK